MYPPPHPRLLDRSFPVPNGSTPKYCDTFVFVWFVWLFSQVATSQLCNLPSCKPKSVLATVLDLLANPNLTIEKLPLPKLLIWEVATWEIVTWEVPLGKMPNTVWYVTF